MKRRVFSVKKKTRLFDYELCIKNHALESV